MSNFMGQSDSQQYMGWIREPEVQAEPLEPAIPLISRLRSNASFMNSKLKLTLPGSRSFRMSVKAVCSTVDRIPVIRRSGELPVWHYVREYPEQPAQWPCLANDSRKILCTCPAVSFLGTAMQYLLYLYSFTHIKCAYP